MMEAETYDPRAYANADRLSPAEAPQQKPLTLHITDQTEGSLAVAYEIRSRLWSLQDRLFGPKPPSTSGANSAAKEAPASCFADAAKSGGRALRGVIDDIDNLTDEIANRL